MGQFITYAQNNEDVILNAYFSDVAKGVYVDVGAYHPKEDSVTKHFYEKGWRGVNIEPVKRLYGLLVEDRPEDVNVHAGISDKPGTLKLREYANVGLSTFSDDIKRHYHDDPDPQTAIYQDVAVSVTTLRDLFAQYDVKHIHFMKIDVQGFEREVLQGNDWKRYRPEMICIEAGHIVENKDWRLLLESHHYTKVWNDGLNDYYLAKESLHRAKNFSYAKTLLLGDQILPYRIHDQWSELSQVNKQFQQRTHDEWLKYRVLDTKVKQLQHEIFVMNERLVEQQRFRSAVKLTLRAIDRIILAQIGRLHVARRRKPMKLANHAVELSLGTLSKEALLEAVREADVRTYYSGRRRRAPHKFYLYHLLNGSYRRLRRVGKAAARMIRKIKRSDDVEA
jgi:FkbM family methyltransferase